LYAVKEGKNYNTYGIGGSLNSKKLASNMTQRWYICVLVWLLNQETVLYQTLSGKIQGPVCIINFKSTNLVNHLDDTPLPPQQVW
jgi:hypothetical protein